MRWALLIVLAAGVAAAAPQVEIKAQTQLNLTRIRLRDSGVAEITGQLVDRLTGDGIGNQRIVIKVGDNQLEVSTNADGTFVGTIDVDPGPQTFQLAFRGGGPIDAAQPVSIVTDPSRSPVALAVSKVDDDHHGAHIMVRALAEDQSIKLPIQLSVGPTSDETKLTHVAQIDSNAPFLLTRAKAGGPGPRHVRAAFVGDDARQSATADATIELSATSQTTIDGPSGAVAFEDDLAITGKVTDDDDAALARAAVTLTSGDRRLAQGATADDGSYKFKLEAEILGQGQYGLQVSAEPGATYIKGSKSRPLIVKIAPPEPVPVSYTVAAFVATALAAGGFFLLRARPWQKLRRPASAANAPASASADAPLVGGLVANKPSIVSTLRRPSDDGFSGVVRDTVRGRAVPGATVRLVLGELEREIRTDDSGGFAIEHLAVGEWAADVAAPGLITERFAVTIPHRGELRDVRIDLVPVREKVFQLYRRAAEPVLPEPRLWGVWSPRQIVDHVKARRPTPALAELTDFVEELYFSPRVAAETVVAGASERVDRAIRERIRIPN